MLCSSLFLEEANDLASGDLDTFVDFTEKYFSVSLLRRLERDLSEGLCLLC